MNSGFYPFQLSDTTNFSSWKTKHILIARNQTNNDLTVLSFDMAGLLPL
jgi:hypothetical protein